MHFEQFLEQMAQRASPQESNKASDTYDAKNINEVLQYANDLHHSRATAVKYNILGYLEDTPASQNYIDSITKFLDSFINYTIEPSQITKSSSLEPAINFNTVITAYSPYSALDDLITENKILKKDTLSFEDLFKKYRTVDYTKVITEKNISVNQIAFLTAQLRFTSILLPSSVNFALSHAENSLDALILLCNETVENAVITITTLLHLTDSLHFVDKEIDADFFQTLLVNQMGLVTSEYTNITDSIVDMPIDSFENFLVEKTEKLVKIIGE